MRSSLSHEFCKLVRDARLFVQNQMHPNNRKGTFSPAPQPNPIAVATTLPIEEPKKQIAVPPKKGNWELYPMPTVDTPSTFYKKLSHFVTVTEVQLPILLVLPEEHAGHRLFLENVARTITRTFAAASVATFHERLLQSSQNKILLIPVDLLAKKYPGCEPHKRFQTASFTALPLEILDKYQEDVHCKRALWTAIQNLFQS
jgi:hypothetical protein